MPTFCFLLLCNRYAPAEILQGSLVCTAVLRITCLFRPSHFLTTFSFQELYFFSNLNVHVYQHKTPPATIFIKKGKWALCRCFYSVATREFSLTWQHCIRFGFWRRGPIRGVRLSRLIMRQTLSSKQHFRAWFYTECELLYRKYALTFCLSKYIATQTNTN